MAFSEALFVKTCVSKVTTELSRCSLKVCLWQWSIVPSESDKRTVGVLLMIHSWGVNIHISISTIMCICTGVYESVTAQRRTDQRRTSYKLETNHLNLIIYKILFTKCIWIWRSQMLKLTPECLRFNFILLPYNQGGHFALMSRSECERNLQQTHTANVSHVFFLLQLFVCIVARNFS